MKIRSKQQGFALFVLIILMATAAATVSVRALNNNRNISRSNSQSTNDRITPAALAQAKEALTGYAITYRDTHPNFGNGYLPNPDLGPGVSAEGNASGSFSGNSKDHSIIGKVPWKTLGISPPRDRQGECLWYVVSGRFKSTPKTDALNWDTLGQIDVVDAGGNTVATNLAALVIAPEKPLDGQARTLVDANHPQCGGNYDARNYLDAYNVTDAISAEVNYFTGSTNNSRAPNTGNKYFVRARNDHYNDQFIPITVDDLFRIIIKNDFSAQIQMLLDDPDFRGEVAAVTVSGSKGTSNIECHHIDNDDAENFCDNWKEMLLLTQLPAPATITIDGTATSLCNRVLIFGGQKTGAQVRVTSVDKTAPANYLEGTNLSAFATPTASSNNFNGASTFDAGNPGADLLRCLP